MYSSVAILVGMIVGGIVLVTFGYALSPDKNAIWDESEEELDLTDHFFPEGEEN